MTYKLNLPPFYIGQKVVCVSSSEAAHGDKVFKGAIYTVLETGHLPENDIHIAYDYVIVKGNGGYWDICRFAPIQEAPAPLLTFSEIKKTEKEEILILN